MTKREHILITKRKETPKQISFINHIIVRNPSAYWLPEIKIEEEIDGTVYSVTGSYEGSASLDKKLARIMLHNWEDSE